MKPEEVIRKTGARHTEIGAGLLAATADGIVPGIRWNSAAWGAAAAWAGRSTLRFLQLAGKFLAAAQPAGRGFPPRLALSLAGRREGYSSTGRWMGWGR